MHCTRLNTHSLDRESANSRIHAPILHMYTMGVTHLANCKYPVHCPSRRFLVHDLSYIYQCCGFMDS